MYSSGELCIAEAPAAPGGARIVYSRAAGGPGARRMVPPGGLAGNGMGSKGAVGDDMGPNGAEWGGFAGAAGDGTTGAAGRLGRAEIAPNRAESGRIVYR